MLHLGEQTQRENGTDSAEKQSISVHPAAPEGCGVCMGKNQNEMGIAE